MRSILELPEIAVHTIHILVDAGRSFIILHVDVVDSVSQAVILCRLSPTPVFDHIIYTPLSGMADGLKGIASN
jgi:hypothetical protein